jgi:nicotinamide-nucleotide adenylyltransferase
MTKRGIFIGRFQPLHNGHISVIRKALSEVDELIIGIGSSQHGYTELNPFTLEERTKMIVKSIKGNYKIIPIPDIDDYPAWVKHVEKLCPKFEVVYTESPITKDLFNGAGYEIRIPAFEAGVSGTKIRKSIAKRDSKWKSMVPAGTLEVILEAKGEERLYYLQENYKYPKPTMTVDAVIEYAGGIVYVKRKNSPFKGQLALPGGHTESGENVEKAVIREVKEETGLDFEIDGLLGVYNDLGRDPRGYYATIAFYGRGKGKLKAGDDAADVFVSKNVPKNLAFDHEKIVGDYHETK